MSATPTDPTWGGHASQRARFRRIRELHDRYRAQAAPARQLFREFTQSQDPFFRAWLCGGHRTKRGSRDYDTMLNLSRALDAGAFDVVHGGGPGAMEAAGLGVTNGNGNGNGNTISIAVQLGFVDQGRSEVFALAFEALGFDDRIATMYALSNVVVCAPGSGIGTLFEAMHALQMGQKAALAHRHQHTKFGVPLDQYLHAEQLPDRKYLYTDHPWVRYGFIPKVIFLGQQFWRPMFDQVENMLSAETPAIDPEDRDLMVLSDSVDDAYALIEAERESWRKRMQFYGIQPLN